MYLTLDAVVMDQVSPKAVKRAMPIMNYKKGRGDNRFFRKQLRIMKRNQREK